MRGMNRNINLNSFPDPNIARDMENYTLQSNGSTLKF
jgi:hypothetical protein